MAIHDEPDDKPRHTIRVVARRTGLTPTTLRAWERRYGAVRPSRSDTERRLYTDSDIERLTLMRTLSAAGHGLQQLAAMSREELEALARAEPHREPADAPTRPPNSPVSLLRRCERAVAGMEGDELHRLLLRGIIELGPDTFIHDLAAPLCVHIGEGWERGTLTVAHEHVASVAVRQALDFLLDRLRNHHDAPLLVATTPSGEQHEFGVMMAAAVALMAGWRVTYLGPDLPAREVAAAIAESDVAALALSIVGSTGSSRVSADLRDYRDVLHDTPIIVGGAGAAAHAAVLADIAAHRVDDLRALPAVLAGLAAHAEPAGRLQ